MIDGVGELAAAMGLSRSRTLELLRQHPTTADRVSAFTAERKAELAVAAVEALRALTPEDLDDLSSEADTAEALSDLVDKRAEYHLRAKVAAHASWAKTEDPAARTAPAREAFMARFERQVDPDGVLSPEDRQRRAEHARKAYFARLALASSKARRARKAAS